MSLRMIQGVLYFLQVKLVNMSLQVKDGYFSAQELLLRI
jgi:hypothetical protein